MNAAPESSLASPALPEAGVSSSPHPRVPGAADATPTADGRFTTLRRVAHLAFALQFLALAAWKAFMFSRFSGTLDENEYQQSMYLISRGVLDPVTTAWGRAFIHDHGSFFIWLLAPLDWLRPTGLWLLWAGVACVVAAEVIAFRWILDACERAHGVRDARLLATLGLVVLVASPWTWWVVSFDVHGELFAAPFIILAAWRFSQGRDRAAWLWVACTLGIGAIVSSWIVGLGVSAAVAALVDRRRRRRLALTAGALAGTGLAFLMGLSALGLDNGSNLNTLYGYLTVPAHTPIPHKLGPGKLLISMATHPLRVVHGLLNHLQDLYANLAPTGWIGLATPWSFGVPITILLENNLVGSFRFSGPIFQSTPIYTFGAVGLVLVLLALAPRWRRGVSVALVVGLSLNCLGWAVVFLPHLEHQWVLVDSAQARTLSSVEAMIPESSEVIVSQGEIARFSMRRYVYGSTNQYQWPLETPDVWIVITPQSGIEFTIEHDDTVIQRLLDDPLVHLVLVQNDIYVFHLVAPPSLTRLVLAPKNGVVVAALATGPSGRGVFEGTSRDWTAVSTGVAGYVCAHDYWGITEGAYHASVRLANATPVNVEVWDVDDDRLLARDELVPDPHNHLVRVPFTLSTLGAPQEAYRGWGPWTVRWKPAGKPGQNQVEIRVWTPGGGTDVVRSLALHEGT